MDKLKRIQTNRAPSAIGPYSQAISFSGFIFTSGQIAIDPATGRFSGDEIESQTERVIANLRCVLESAGSGLDKVVRTTMYLKRIEDYAAANEIYARHFAHRPARTTIGGVQLPKGALVEIDCIAIAKGDIRRRVIRKGRRKSG